MSSREKSGSTEGVDDSTSHQVYIRSKDEAWIPGRLLRVNEEEQTALVQVRSQTKHVRGARRDHESVVVNLKDYPNNALPLQNVSKSGSLLVVADMVDLPFLHESAILFNLKARHATSQPYTRTGAIIVAVNPYQWIRPLYTPERCREYSRKLVWDRSPRFHEQNLDPHVYEISALAYRGLALGQEDQSILVSGESGAGKTETVKICLEHIASVQLGEVELSTNLQQAVSPIVQRILDSNPLLEAFGNAKTIRNDNSSRFGKYLQLQFDSEDPATAENKGKKMPDCRMVGSQCEVYLLEKSRVICHNDDERTFHIFYQLLAAPEATKREIWKGLAGKTNESFRYAGYTATTKIEGKSDCDRFSDTMRALDMVGIKGDSLMALLQAISAVLQLGNLEFSPSMDEAERSHISSIPEFAILSSLLGIKDCISFEKAFTERRFEARGEVLTVTMSVEKAKDNCDAFAKEIYSRSFLWLVRKINEATSTSLDFVGSDRRLGTIGLLDIFGFETFETNGFEQLCINYANEMIQQKFTQDVFSSVMHEYEFEGIAMKDIHFEDNTDVLDLIEGRSGLLAMLNEECVRPNGNDATFVRKAILTNKDSQCLISERMFGGHQFGITHYAGTVVYDAQGFVNKNSDHVPLDLLKIATSSTNEIISKHLSNDGMGIAGELASPGPGSQSGAPAMPGKSGFGDSARKGSTSRSPGRGRNKSKTVVGITVWTKFKTQLNSLMGKLVETETRYIRCIKPNSTKSPLLMEQLPTVEQLRCAGVVAAVTISRSAFPNRLEHGAVLARFKSLWTGDLKHCEDGSFEEQQRADVETLLTRILKDLATGEGSQQTQAFVVGLTRTYFRAGALEHLETLRLDGMHFLVAELQKYVRGHLQRKTFMKQKKSSIVIQAAMRRQLCMARFRHQIRGVIVLQSCCRRIKAKRHVEVLRGFTFATRIQTQWRAYVLRSQFTRSRKASIQVQRIMRGKLERLRYPTIREKKQEQLKMADQIARMRAKLAEEEDQKKAELLELKKIELQRDQEARMQKLKEERQAMEYQLKEIEMERELQQLRDQVEHQRLAATRPPEIPQIFPVPERTRSVSPSPPVPRQAHAPKSAPVMTEEQKRLMEESGKIIDFLRKENLRLKKKAEQQRKDFATLKENNQRLMEANASAGSSFQSLNQHARTLSGTNQKLLKTVAQYRNRVTQLHSNIKNRQKYCKDLQGAYKLETEGRAFYEQTLLTIVDKISSHDCDPEVQELVMAKAVECAQMSQRVSGRAAPALEEEEADLSVSESADNEST